MWWGVAGERQPACCPAAHPLPGEGHLSPPRPAQQALTSDVGDRHPPGRQSQMHASWATGLHRRGPAPQGAGMTRSQAEPTRQARGLLYYPKQVMGRVPGNRSGLARPQASQPMWAPAITGQENRRMPRAGLATPSPPMPPGTGCAGHGAQAVGAVGPGSASRCVQGWTGPGAVSTQCPGRHITAQRLVSLHSGMLKAPLAVPRFPDRADRPRPGRSLTQKGDTGRPLSVGSWLLASRDTCCLARFLWAVWD